MRDAVAGFGTGVAAFLFLLVHPDGAVAHPHIENLAAPEHRLLLPCPIRIQAAGEITGHMFTADRPVVPVAIYEVKPVAAQHR